MIVTKIYNFLSGFKNPVLEKILGFFGLIFILLIIYMRIIRKRLPRELEENLELYKLCLYIFITLIFVVLFISGIKRMLGNVKRKARY